MVPAGVGGVPATVVGVYERKDAQILLTSASPNVIVLPTTFR